MANYLPSPRLVPPTYRLGVYEIAGSPSPERWTADDLPAGWDRFPYPPSTQQMGSDWLRQGKASLLVVPSAAVPGGLENIVLASPARLGPASIRLIEVHERLYNPRAFEVRPRHRRQPGRHASMRMRAIPADDRHDIGFGVALQLRASRRPRAIPGPGRHHHQCPLGRMGRPNEAPTGAPVGGRRYSNRGPLTASKQSGMVPRGPTSSSRGLDFHARSVLGSPARRCPAGSRKSAATVHSRYPAFSISARAPSSSSR